MVATNILYEALLTVLPTTYKLKFSYLEASTVSGNKTIINKNIGAIYFRSAGNSEYRKIGDGEYGIDQYRMIINLYTDRGESGVLAGLDYCAKVCDILDKLYNTNINVNGTNVFICETKRLGNYQYMGPTEQGIASFSINYLVKFK